jgi:hypothetical protein
MTPHKNLWINYMSDPEAIQLPCFSCVQLCELFIHFDIAGLLDPGDEKLQILIL